jgi:hypothetical protein
VLAEIDRGAATLTEVARGTGLDRQVVEAALDRLVAAGYLDAQAMLMGCPPSGCGDCSSSCDVGGCPPVPPGVAAGGPGLVGLTITTREG